jgi:lysophospholipase L1-like esterase
MSGAMARTSEISVYLFGDSICVGQHVSPHRIWGSLLSAALEADFGPKGHNIIVQIPARNGNTTVQALERVAFEVQSHKPDFLYIQFGMNDCNYWDTDLGLPRVSPESFRSNIEELVRRGYQHGAKKVFVPTNHPTTRTITKLAKGQGPTYEESNARYAAILREAAKKAGAQVIDTWGAFEKSVTQGALIENLLLPDGLHLSVLGHEVYFQTTYPMIREAIASNLQS